MSKKSGLAERLVLFCVFFAFAGLIVLFALSQTPSKVNDSDDVTSFQYKTSSKTETVSSENESVISLININTATLEELQTLPGIGEKKAQAIIDYRKQYGPFNEIDDIVEVSGIGEATFKKLKPYITVE